MTEPKLKGIELQDSSIEFQASKPFAEFEGNWNAEYHWTIDKEGPNEFVDTRNISTKNKMVKVLSQQEPTESRRLWKDVTEVRFLRVFITVYIQLFYTDFPSKRTALEKTLIFLSVFQRNGIFQRAIYANLFSEVHKLNFLLIRNLLNFHKRTICGK